VGRMGQAGDAPNISPEVTTSLESVT
jgi:hypothetical protein